ncbi:MAG TPA: HEAT repeat domain-containing protein, partial [Kofleriaceae bacterium]
ARLSDAMPHVRIAAIEALAHFESPAAWQALASAARSSDPDEARAALVGIGQKARASAIPILIAAARDGDLPTKLIAISGLARQPGAQAIDELARAARDSDEALRSAAISLLGERDDATDVLLALALEAPNPSVDGALARRDRTSSLGTALRDADDATATVIAAALARIADPKATAELFAALDNPNPSARRAAAASLVAIGADGADAATAKLASEDPDPDVRRFCSALRAP